MEEVQIKTSDGLTLLSWYKPAKNGYPTLMYLQGNMGHIGYRISLIRPYLRQGYGVLLLGYRGYGGNPGKPSKPGLLEDSKAGWEFLRSQSMPSSCIVIYGESLGTGPAIQLASEHEAAALILYAPYTSLVELGNHHYPFLPINWLLKDRFDSLSKIAAVHAPILIAVAENDYVVPLRFGTTLFKAANNPKQFVMFPDLGHNDMLQMSQRQMIDFIAKYVHCSAVIRNSG